MTRPDLDAIEARAAATPGPLTVESYISRDSGHTRWRVGDPDDSSVPWFVFDREADALLFASARPDLLALVARVRELEAALSAAIDVMSSRTEVGNEDGDAFNDEPVIEALTIARAAMEGT